MTRGVTPEPARTLHPADKAADREVELGQSP